MERRDIEKDLLIILKDKNYDEIVSSVSKMISGTYNYELNYMNKIPYDTMIKHLENLVKKVTEIDSEPKSYEESKKLVEDFAFLLPNYMDYSKFEYKPFNPRKNKKNSENKVKKAKKVKYSNYKIESDLLEILKNKDNEDRFYTILTMINGTHKYEYDYMNELSYDIMIEHLENLARKVTNLVNEPTTFEESMNLAMDFSAMIPSFDKKSLKAKKEKVDILNKFKESKVLKTVEKFKNTKKVNAKKDYFKFDLDYKKKKMFLNAKISTIVFTMISGTMLGCYLENNKKTSKTEKENDINYSIVNNFSNSAIDELRKAERQNSNLYKVALENEFDEYIEDENEVEELDFNLIIEEADEDIEVLDIEEEVKEETEIEPIEDEKEPEEEKTGEQETEPIEDEKEPEEEKTGEQKTEPVEDEKEPEEEKTGEQETEPIGDEKEPEEEIIEDPVDELEKIPEEVERIEKIKQESEEDNYYSEKIDQILLEYNLTPEQFDIVTAICLAEAEANSYVDAYCVINTMYNRIMCPRWVNHVENNYGEDAGTSLYYQAVCKGQFAVYSNGSYKKFVGVHKGNAYQGVIDFLTTKTLMHTYLNFGANYTEVGPNSVQFSPHGNKYYKDLLNEENYLTSSMNR